MPWLRQHLLAAVADYAAGIEVDTGKIERAMADVDMQNPEAMQAALAGGLFEPEDSEQQKAALVRLETALALVEGWVDDVVREATKDRMPSAVQLAETVRRRRAAGGPAEQTFATLVGLQLRPRRLRDAANLWAAVRDARGVEGRDELWSHPDLLPERHRPGRPDRLRPARGRAGRYRHHRLLRPDEARRPGAPMPRTTTGEEATTATPRPERHRRWWTTCRVTSLP